MKEFTEQDYEQMDKYIKQQLSEVDRKAFEQRIKIDPALADELAWVRKMEANYRYIKLKDHVTALHQQLNEEGVLDTGTVVKSFWQNWRRILSIAATVVLLVGAGWFVWLNNQESVKQPTLVQALPSERLIEPSTPPPVMDGSDLAEGYARQLPKDEIVIPLELTEAVNYYRNDRPDAAIAALRALPSPATPPSEDRFGSTKGEKGTTAPLPAVDTKNQQYRYLYLGLSYLKKGEAQKAVRQLKKVHTASLRPTAEWYEALGLVLLHQEDAARLLLNKIRNNPDHLYQLEAAEVWEAME